MKEYPETHQVGSITIDKIPRSLRIKGDLGIQIAEDGRVWICINGESFMRFRPENQLKGGDKRDIICTV
jgi:hypothetical protein